MADSISSLFPSDFVWGAATAAYQIEGAVDADGRGESIWDRFSHTPGRTLNGETGDVACDHYHRFREDVTIMRDLGVEAYRFSIAWPRIIPDGTGRVNQAGLDFYDRLVHELLEAGITPFPTLYHWDLPQPLEDAGGWPLRATAHAFAEYAAVVGERLGDRVKDWWTINEPWCVAELGYRYGDHAPGRHDPHDALAASHHVLLAHGLGMQALRAAIPAAQVGIVTNHDFRVPRSDHVSDRRASELGHAVNSRWYLDPIYLGEYPELAVHHHRWDQEQIFPGDMEIISSPVDHHGINYYTRTIERDEGVDDLERPQPIVEAALPRTTMGWEIYPDGLRDLLVRLNNDYNLPSVYITENGAAFPDEVIDGEVHDSNRTEFLQRHLAAAAEAMNAGVPLSGYFVWSLMDNFEWARGYGQRFGLVHVDYDTQKRTLKDSANWYRAMLSGRT
ncbi:MAG: GH1 family beta-glucosidase [Myxococcales bacterium]|nr:GH1 family beta-glucosidase [Myxococcales bacterium]